MFLKVFSVVYFAVELCFVVVGSGGVLFFFFSFGRVVGRPHKQTQLQKILIIKSCRVSFKQVLFPSDTTISSHMLFHVHLLMHLLYIILHRHILTLQGVLQDFWGIYS